MPQLRGSCRQHFSAGACPLRKAVLATPQPPAAPQPPVTQPQGQLSTHFSGVILGWGGFLLAPPRHHTLRFAEKGEGSFLPAGAPWSAAWRGRAAQGDVFQLTFLAPSHLHPSALTAARCSVLLLLPPVMTEHQVTTEGVPSF